MLNYLWGTAEAPKRRLRVRIGPSLDCMSVYNVNDDKNPHFVDSELFCGNIVVRIKNFAGITPESTEPIKDTPYFGTKRRVFSIQWSCRFKQDVNISDVVFGAEFQDKVQPPMGTSIALKFANMIDPALKTDVYADKPWLLSPILCSMNVLNVVKNESKVPDSVAALLTNNETMGAKTSKSLSTKAASVSNIKPSPNEFLGEWQWGAEAELQENSELLAEGLPFASADFAERRKFFQKDTDIKFTTDKVYNMEIFAPFIDLNTFDLNLGISVNLVGYVNKQPIRILAKLKNEPLFIIEFDLIDEKGNGLAQSS